MYICIKQLAAARRYGSRCNQGASLQQVGSQLFTVGQALLGQRTNGLKYRHSFSLGRHCTVTNKADGVSKENKNRKAFKSLPAFDGTPSVV